MREKAIVPSSQPRFKIRPVLFISAILLILAGYKIYLDVFSPNVNTVGNKKNYVVIHAWFNTKKLLAELEKGSLLNNYESFRRLSNLIDLEKKLKPGRYLLKPGMNNFEIVKMLVNGRQVPLDVVLNQAERIENLCGFFSKELDIDSAKFLLFLKDTNLIGPLGFDSNTIISMFIPNTYNFYWNTNSANLFNRMHAEYKKFWTAERLQNAMEAGLTQNQVSTLAAIVQKESNKRDEMPTIAGVYLNRIKLGMPLQADPTLIFAWNDHNIRRVTNVHTAIVSPYNTYLNVGLPPGPICLPSVQAIDAVLNYEKSNYLYFCAREDFSGYHSFAANFNQHQQNARRYQRALNENKIY